MMWPPVPPLTPVEMRMGGSPSSGIRLMELPTGLPTVATGVWATWGVEGHMLERTIREAVEKPNKLLTERDFLKVSAGQFNRLYKQH